MATEKKVKAETFEQHQERLKKRIEAAKKKKQSPIPPKKSNVKGFI